MMARHARFLSLSLTLSLVVPASASAGVPACDALTGSAKDVADRVLAAEHPYDCCDDTIAACLKKQPACKLPARLAAFVCRRAAAGQDADTIRRSLEKRALFRAPGGRQFTIDLSTSPAVGCTQAKLKVVAYLCARCPYCSKLFPALYTEVTKGTLAGRVALHVRLFPIKGHPGSAEANRAIVAAGRLGKGWEYLLHAYRSFDRFSFDALPQWASDVGLDRAAFDAVVADPATNAQLVDSKKEGLRNGVESTPTLFINGVKYTGDLDIETIRDVLEEMLEGTP